MKWVFLVIAILVVVAISATTAFIPPPQWANRDVFAVKILLFLATTLLAINVGISLYSRWHIPKSETVILRTLGFLWIVGPVVCYALVGLPSLKQVRVVVGQQDQTSIFPFNAGAELFKNDPPSMILWIWISIVVGSIFLVSQYVAVQAARSEDRSIGWEPRKRRSRKRP
jgi:hypothetical protein